MASGNMFARRRPAQVQSPFERSPSPYRDRGVISPPPPSSGDDYPYKGALTNTQLIPRVTPHVRSPFGAGYVTPLSSPQAGQMSEGAAGFSGLDNSANMYNGKYRQPDLSGFQPGKSVQSVEDPTNTGSRFGKGGALNPMGDYAQSGQSWYDRLPASEKYGYGQTTPGVDGRISSDRKYATGMLPEDKDRPTRDTPEDRAYLARKYDEQERRQRDYRDEHGGMSSRQVRRQEQKDRTKNFQFGQAMQNGLNPMSPQAKFLFPKQVEAMNAPTNNPMAAGPQRTPAGQTESAQKMESLAQTAPVLATMNLPAGAKVSDVHAGLSARMTEDPNVQFSDADIKALQEYARNAANVSTKENDQFAIDSGGFGSVQDQIDSDMWRELARLPDNERVRQDWFGRFRNRTKTQPGFNDQAQQKNNSGRDSGGNMFDVPYGM